MNAMNKSLNQLRDEAVANAVAKGFTDASFVECLALIHSEVSEALEDYRDGLKPSEFRYESPRTGEMYKESDFKSGIDSTCKPCGIPSELADIIIRVRDLAGRENIDLERAVEEKLAYNESRPFRHGKVI